MNELDALFDILAKGMGVSKEQVLAQVARQRQRRAQRAVRANERYAEALEQITPKQLAMINELRAAGARVQSRIWQNRRSGNVCVILSAERFNSARGRIMHKLFAVYPDGTRSETFERSISIRTDY